jgi:DNA polymerase-3 subunit epsilon
VFDLIKEKNVVILDQGRVHGEKSFIYLEEGYLKGYGFGNLNFQHSKQAIVKRLISPLIADETSHEIITKYTDRHQYQVLELKD